MAQIHVLDVTNRDGVQTARTGLSKFGKTMVNSYLGRLGVAQSEIGFPFLFHEVPYVRAQVALSRAGAFGDLRLSGWCRGVVADVEKSLPLGLDHYNLSISTSDYMLANKFRGRLDRNAVLREVTAAVRTAKAGGAQTVGVNAEDGSRTDDGFLLEFTLAAKEAGADRVRYCDTIGGDTPDRIRDRFAKLASAAAMPVETHCHNDLGLAVANTISGALGDLDAGQDAWVNTCINGVGERAGNADLLSTLLAFRHGFGVAGRSDVTMGDPIDLSWARRFSMWASYALGQPLPMNQVGSGRNAFAHESGIHADGALKDHGNYELYDEQTLGPFPSDWHRRDGRVVLTGEYGGKAGFRHVMDGLGVESADEDLAFKLVQLCNAQTGRPLTDDELRLIATHPHELALLFPGQIP